MKNIAVLLLFCILISSCAKQEKKSPQAVADCDCLAGSCFSWFVAATIKKPGKKKLRLEQGMAIAIRSLPEQCIILTNKHIITKAKHVRVSPWSTFNDQEQHEIEATVIYEDPKIDAALLSFPHTGGCTTGKISENDPSLIEPILLLGQPVHLTGAITRGIVSGYWYTDHGKLMVSDAVGVYGFSGSGVMDQQNNIVGLVTGKTADEKKGFTYIIPPSRLKSILEKSTEHIIEEE